MIDSLIVGQVITFKNGEKSTLAEIRKEVGAIVSKYNFTLIFNNQFYSRYDKDGNCEYDEFSIMKNFEGINGLKKMIKYLDAIIKQHNNLLIDIMDTRERLQKDIVLWKE